MVGGERETFEHLRPLLSTLAPNEDGYDYFGGHGAGHFTKMVHNGIEYGLMQAYGEGFEIIKWREYEVDMSRLSQVWNNGSVVRSWLLELAQRAFEQEGDFLPGIRGYVEDSGEGRWTVLEAIAHRSPRPLLRSRSWPLRLAPGRIVCRAGDGSPPQPVRRPRGARRRGDRVADCRRDDEVGRAKHTVHSRHHRQRDAPEEAGEKEMAAVQAAEDAEKATPNPAPS